MFLAFLRKEVKISRYRLSILNYNFFNSEFASHNSIFPPTELKIMVIMTSYLTVLTFLLAFVRFYLTILTFPLKIAGFHLAILKIVRNKVRIGRYKLRPARKMSEL